MRDYETRPDHHEAMVHLAVFKHPLKLRYRADSTSDQPLAAPPSRSLTKNTTPSTMATQALDALLDRLADVATPAGPTPHQIGARPTPTMLPIAEVRHRK